MLQYAVLLGAAVNVACCFSYVRDTAAGKTKPNRVTFLLWSLAPFIGAAAALSNGVRWAVLPTFLAGFCPFIIFLVSFANEKSYWKLQKLDYFCGFLSLLALALWKVTRDPNIAIAFAIASDGLAAIPTIKKSWTHPKTENPILFAGGSLSAATSFFAVQAWAFSAYAFPGYLIIIDLSIFFIISYRRWRRGLTRPLPPP